MNVQLKAGDAALLRMAADLLDRGRQVAFEMRQDGTFECVEIVGNPTAGTQAALAEAGEPVPNNDIAAWLDEIDQA